MAFDEELAERVRRQVGEYHGLSEKKMFAVSHFFFVAFTEMSLLFASISETIESMLAKPGKRVLGITSRPMKVAIGGWRSS